MADSTLIKHIGSNPSNILPQLLMLLPNREHPMQRIVNQMFTPPHTNRRKVSKINIFAALQTVCTNRARRLFVYL